MKKTEVQETNKITKTKKTIAAKVSKNGATPATKKSLRSLKLTKEEVLNDYKVAFSSRQASLLGRREVLTGKAKFGIFGDGKEIAQLAMAKVFQKGDFRSGYYRDQTFMFAVGESDIQKFYAQLYAHTDTDIEPASGGRSMNGHFATRSLNADGSWKNLMDIHNSSADVSPTGSQMPRLVGLAQASKVYRHHKPLHTATNFSNQGNEVAFGTIGNASSAEGMFWESINAAGVLGVPMVMSVWDDGYGISVPNEYQLTKGNISELLSGFQRTATSTNGYEIYVVRGWDYPTLVETYRKATDIARRDHVPAIIHVTEVTQPQGHSTSGSHERYKTPERLQWEEEFDGVKRMRAWMIEQKVISDVKLAALEKEWTTDVQDAKERAWKAYSEPIHQELEEAAQFIDAVAQVSTNAQKIQSLVRELRGIREPFRKDIMECIHQVLLAARNEYAIPAVKALITWREQQEQYNRDRYSSHLYSQSEQSALKVQTVPPVFAEKPESAIGYEVLNRCFDSIFSRDERVVAFGEDVGKLGDVNQAFAGLQEKYSELRISDTGIREVTILGQAIGLAMRGLRPIAEIQYLDYILYALQIMSDDLATLQYRTKGGQKAPVIVRTRGHRLEGIWHSGSPMAGIINLVRGMHVLVPRNMVQATGFYNTLMKADEPAIIVEVLNGYRLREAVPQNLSEFTVPLGVPEVLREGTDVTIVTYGPLCRIATTAAKQLEECGISVELIDVQSLLPFDLHGVIGKSLQKTNRILFLDEDVPGGTTAYMMQKVIEEQEGYKWLDSAPKTLAAQPHRPAYGTDGNYWSKPSEEHVFQAVYEMMHEANPQRFPLFYSPTHS
jgi:pyruvate/2-oxoglutarate/acetoin dehydrogenase E1 component/TPP-dependent pyruvate/acetoin dehydrogenase alpha subunit